MRSRLRNLPLVLVAVGILLAFPGSDIVSSERTGFLLSVGGSVLAWGSGAVMGVRKDDLWHDIITEDERIRQHTYRAAYVTWFAVLAVGSTLLALSDYYPAWVEPHYPIILIQIVTVGVFFGAYAVIERRM